MPLRTRDAMKRKCEQMENLLANCREHMTDLAAFYIEGQETFNKDYSENLTQLAEIDDMFEMMINIIADYRKTRI